MTSQFAQLRFPIPFTKMSGTGNDFIIIDHRQPFLPTEVMPEFARRVCRHKFSAGADGLILIEQDSVQSPLVSDGGSVQSPLERDENVDFRWQFFNADGSRAEMCGNGARCAARFAFRAGIAPAAMRFRTMAGVIAAQMAGDGVKIKMTRPANLQMAKTLDLGPVTREVYSVNTGVPHAVCFADDLAAVPVVEWGRLLRYHETYQPAGTNVNFVQITPAGLLVRTYERGVEGETMACGTGAVASALIAVSIGQAKSPVKVTTSGGEELVIHLEGDTANQFEAYLEGPAKFIYDAQLQAEALT